MKLGKRTAVILLFLLVGPISCGILAGAKALEKSNSQEHSPYEQGAWLVKSYEGLHYRPYICPAGHPTIGWGHVIKDWEWKRYTGIEKEDFYAEWNALNKKYGRDKANKIYEKSGKAIPMSAYGADMLFTLDFHNYVGKTLEVFPNLKDHPNKLYAITSLAYNIKGGARKLGKSGIGASIRAEKWDRVERTLLAYNKANGKVLSGLSRRREAEATLFRGETLNFYHRVITKIQAAKVAH